MNKMQLPALILSGLLASAALPVIADSTAPAPAPSGPTDPVSPTPPGIPPSDNGVGDDDGTLTPGAPGATNPGPDGTSTDQGTGSMPGGGGTDGTNGSGGMGGDGTGGSGGSGGGAGGAGGAGGSGQ